MKTSEIAILFIIGTLMLLVFFIFMVLIIIEYRRRQVRSITEKLELKHKHETELMQTQADTERRLLEGEKERLEQEVEARTAEIQAEKENAEYQRARAERSERFKQQFLANMSHEIRTPMNAVNGMTDLLLDKSPRPDQLGYLHVISRSSGILLHIINDILDLSKIEAGKLELEQIDFSLAESIRQVKDILSVKAEEKGLQLVTSVGSGISDILCGDPYRLNQILINLGNNAIKFTDKGSVEIAVEQLQGEDENVKLRFSVTDTGIGIPADKTGALFGDFQQLNNSDTRKYGGTGLGLSICKQLVEMQGGSIVVESVMGRGSVFSFTLAFPKGSAEKMQARLLSEQKIDSASLDGLRILVADDNEYNLMVTRETLLSKAKVQVDEAMNGLQAIDMLRQNDYDLVLMDVQMPVLNGLDATRIIRNELPAPKNKIPIVAQTASLLRRDIEKCIEAGMNTFVPKPFKAWQLIRAIAEMTGRNMGAGTNAPQTTIHAPAQAMQPGQLCDLTYLRDFCEGDEENMKKYIRLYLKAIPTFKTKTGEAAAANDLAEIARLLHGFMPKWMMMGMSSTRDFAVGTEKLCREENPDALAQLPKVLRDTEMSVAELEPKV